MVTQALRKILWFLVFLYLVSFPFGQLTKLPLSLPFPEIRIYATDVLVGVVGCLWAVGWVVIRKKRNTPPFTKELLVFLAVALFSLILNSPLFEGREVLVSSLYLIRVITYVLFYFAVGSVLETAQEKKLLLSSLIAVGSMLAVFGWVQYFLFPDIRPFIEFGWDEHLSRIVGTFLDPNFSALILVLTLVPLTFSAFAKGYGGSSIAFSDGGQLIKKKSLSISLLWIFVFVTLLFTYSRSGYLTFLVSMAAISFLMKKPQLLLISVLLLVVGIALLPRPGGEGVQLARTASNIARLENWSEALSFTSDSPLFGVGFNNLRYVRERKGLLEEPYGPSHAAAGIDNSFLFVLATTGIAGLLVFAALVTQLFKAAWQVYLPRLREQGRQARTDEGNALFVSLVAVVAHSLFLNSMFYPWVMGWMAVLLALTTRRK